MTHEFRNLIEAAYSWNKSGHKVVLATVVALDGSSYRRPGVRMLIHESGAMVGAISGGCVEKEVVRQSQCVFQNNCPKMMTYDGRFRLGCEGILYILLEPISISETLYQTLQGLIRQRKTLQCDSYYSKEIEENHSLGSVLKMGNETYGLSPNFSLEETGTLQIFSHEYSPIFQLYIFGAEHDAVHLCKLASEVGWDVHVIAPPDEQKTIEYFEGATSLSTPIFEDIDTSMIDENTAIVLMTHSFSKDVQYLIALKNVQPKYFGLLGPTHRRERLFSKFLEYVPDVSSEFFERLHGPAGINIGAESASEIGVSIIAEILSVVRQQEPMSLKDKTGKIHG